MEGEESDGGTEGGEESGGAGLSFRLWAVVFIGKWSFAFVGDCSRWRAVVFVCGWGVVSWALIIRAWGALVIRAWGVVVICVVICGRGWCPWGWVVIYGRRVVVCGW